MLSSNKAEVGHNHKQTLAGVERIKLIDLLPGRGDDELRIAIRHLSINDAVDQIAEDPRLTLEELQATLPASNESWRVCKSVNDRYFFQSDYVANTWSHPDPNVPKHYYELPDGFHDKNYKLPAGSEYSVKLDFEALSYTWGPTGDEKPVQLVASDAQVSLLYIRPRLAEALRALRYADRTRVLWIDAICIDQNDPHKNLLVAQMHRIYAMAKNVIIWTGPEADDSGHALTTLSYFGSQTEVLTDGLHEDCPGAEKPFCWMAGEPLPYEYTDREWHAILHLLKRPWFSRVWVLQEAHANRDTILKCGSDEADWYSIRKALYFLDWKRNLLPPDLKAILALYAKGLFPRSGRIVLAWASNQKCEVPLDKVYGILGLFDDRLRSKVRVDYSKTSQQLFETLMRLEFEVYGEVSLLTHCTMTHEVHRSDGWPSWLPDWTMPLRHLRRPSNPRYKWPAGQSRAVVRWDTPEVMTVVGNPCAVIRSVSKRLSGPFEVISQDLRSWMKELEHSEAVLDDMFFQALADAVQANRILKDRFAVATESSDESDLLVNALKQALSSDSLADDGAEILRDIALEEDTLFYTRKGHLGSTHEVINEDDTIAILLGCDSPVILRPLPHGGFSLIGTCFAYGLMQGEGLQLSSKDWEEDIRLPRSLPENWEVANREAFMRDRLGLTPIVFRNCVTGEESSFDPRLTREALQARGVELKEFRLV